MTDDRRQWESHPNTCADPPHIRFEAVEMRHGLPPWVTLLLIVVYVIVLTGIVMTTLGGL